MKTKKVESIKPAVQQAYEPWTSEQIKEMEHTLLEMEVAMLTKDEEVTKLEFGSKDTDREIEAMIAHTEVQVKSLQIKLAAYHWDLANCFTKKRLLFSLNEAKRERERHRENIKAIKRQMEQGRPIPSLPEFPATQEEPVN